MIMDNKSVYRRAAAVARAYGMQRHGAVWVYGDAQFRYCDWIMSEYALVGFEQYPRDMPSDNRNLILVMQVKNHETAILWRLSEWFRHDSAGLEWDKAVVKQGGGMR